MRRTRGEKVFACINAIVLLSVCFVTLYPLWYVIISSFSDPLKVSMGSVIFLPEGFELASYKKVLCMDYFLSSYGNTVFYSVFGVGLSMTLTIMGSYALSKRGMPGRKVLSLLVLFTMWFSAGMMPAFMNYQSLGLYNTRVGVLLSGAINTFNVILLRTFFENVPPSMEESAKIDGANDFQIMSKIYLPLSVPALATITMFYFVDRWNTFFWPMLLLKDQSKVPLQVLLRKMVVEVSYNVNEAVDISATIMTEQTIVYATIVAAVVPMLILYPFLQKFFVRGIMIGAIKG